MQSLGEWKAKKTIKFPLCGASRGTKSWSLGIPVDAAEVDETAANSHLQRNEANGRPFRWMKSDAMATMEDEKWPVSSCLLNCLLAFHWALSMSVAGVASPKGKSRRQAGFILFMSLTTKGQRTAAVRVLNRCICRSSFCCAIHILI